MQTTETKVRKISPSHECQISNDCGLLITNSKAMTMTNRMFGVSISTNFSIGLWIFLIIWIFSKNGRIRIDTHVLKIKQSARYVMIRQSNEIITGPCSSNTAKWKKWKVKMAPNNKNRTKIFISLFCNKASVTFKVILSNNLQSQSIRGFEGAKGV